MPHPKRQVGFICENCGQPFTVKASRGKVRFCCWNCHIEAGRKTHLDTTCKQCGAPIKTYKKKPQKYCSISCATTARNLTDQNPSYHRDISGEKNPMYGKGRKGPANGMYGRTREQNPAWNGGRKIRADGYILVLAPDNHPHSISSGKGEKTRYILEHRLMMEQHLDRYLEPDEVVHHIDGNPSNNDIENLKLFKNHSEHILLAHQEIWWLDIV